jgi:hypothetical protein
MQSHAALEKFSAGNELPLYNQPSDTEVYNINKKKYVPLPNLWSVFRIRDVLSRIRIPNFFFIPDPGSGG